MIGSRQNYAYAEITSGSYKVFTVDREFLIARIKFLPGAAVAEGDTVKIQVEGEILYSGSAVPLALVAVKTDDAIASGQSLSPYVLAFDRPVVLSRDYPVTIWWTDASGGETCHVAIEGP